VWAEVHAGSLAAEAGGVEEQAVCGAEPLYLTLSLIIEEGLPRETLRRVLHSAADGQVVDGAVDGQPADVAAGEE
jgi:hydrogenase expression/formation protein HypE